MSGRSNEYLRVGEYSDACHDIAVCVERLTRRFGSAPVVIPFGKNASTKEIGRAPGGFFSDHQFRNFNEELKMRCIDDFVNLVRAVHRDLLRVTGQAAVLRSKEIDALIERCSYRVTPAGFLVLGKREITAHAAAVSAAEAWIEAIERAIRFDELAVRKKEAPEHRLMVVSIVQAFAGDFEQRCRFELLSPRIVEERKAAQAVNESLRPAPDKTKPKSKKRGRPAKMKQDKVGRIVARLLDNGDADRYGPADLFRRNRSDLPKGITYDAFRMRIQRERIRREQNGN